MVNSTEHIETHTIHKPDECCFCGSDISEFVIAYQNKHTLEVICGTCIQDLAQTLLARNVHLTWDDAMDMQMNHTYDDEL